MIFKDRKFTIILAVIVLVVLIIFGQNWYKQKMNLVERGVASPKFPYHEYTLLELARQGRFADLNDEDRAKFEQELKNLPTRTTPQETLDMYIQALKDGDIEGALNYIEKEDYIEYNEDDPWHPVHFRLSEQDRKYLNDIKEEGYLEDMIKDLEGIRTKIALEMNKIKKGSIGEKEAVYQYQCRVWGGKLDVCYFAFNKSLWGDWEIVGAFLLGSPIL